MIRHRLMLLAIAIIVWLTAIAVYIFGVRWLWFGTGAVGAIVALHIGLVAVAYALGGASLVGAVLQWVRGGATTTETPLTTGKVLHWAWAYDPLVWLMTFGRQQKFREKTLDLAQIAPGNCVLDIGCGTGSLAIAARKRVGPKGRVAGIDASPEMIARAQKKARRAAAEVDFKLAAVEAMPFTDRSFNIVLSTVMLHHLPEDARQKCIAEIRRVLKPGGRFVALDFGGAKEERHTRVGRLHAHAHFDLSHVIPVLNQVGMTSVESGPAGFGDLQFLRAAAPTV